MDDLNFINNRKLMRLYVEGKYGEAEIFKLNLVKICPVWKFLKPYKDRLDMLENNELFLSNPRKGFEDEEDCRGIKWNLNKMKEFLEEKGWKIDELEIEKKCNEFLENNINNVKVCL